MAKRFHPPLPVCVVALSFVASAVTAGGNRQAIEGPVSAELLRVIDGDTLLVAAAPWPDQQITTYVRLRGVDAPEMHARCAMARNEAQAALTALAALVASSDKVSLSNISGDKYFGRVIAEVTLADGRDPAHELLSMGLVTAYDGGRKPKQACGE